MNMKWVKTIRITLHLISPYTPGRTNAAFCPKHMLQHFNKKQPVSCSSPPQTQRLIHSVRISSELLQAAPGPHMFSCDCSGEALMLFLGGNRRGRTASSRSSWFCFQFIFLCLLTKYQQCKKKKEKEKKNLIFCSLNIRTPFVLLSSWWNHVCFKFHKLHFFQASLIHKVHH